MDAVLGLGGIALTILGIGLLIIYFFIKRPKKTPLLMILLGIIMFFVGINLVPSDDTTLTADAPQVTVPEVSAEIPGNENNQEQGTEETISGMPDNAIIFDDTVVYDDHSIIATVTDYSEDSQGRPEFQILVENNSETDYEVEAYYFSVNDIMVSAGIHDSVTAGKKNEITVEFLKDQFDITGISEVDNISMVLSFVSENDNFTSLVDLKIRDKEPDNSYIDGDILYSDDRWDAQLLYTTEDNTAALVSVKNNTDQMMHLSFTDYSVNDYMWGLDISSSQGSGYAMFSTETIVLPHCITLCVLEVNDETLEKTEDISSIDFKISYHFDKVSEPEFLYEEETTDVIKLFN